VALRFMDGFDDYATGTDLDCQWILWSTGAFASPNLIGGRYGGVAYSTNNLYNYSALISSNLPTIIVGFNFATGSGGQFLDIDDSSAGTHIYISFTGGIFYVYLAGSNTLLGTSRMYSSSGWHHVQIKVKLGTGDGELYLRVDGNDELSLTGITTRNPNYPTSGKLNWVKTEGRNNYFDDFFIFDSSGTYNNDIIRDGEPRVQTLWPNANGDYHEWQPSTGSYNYAVIDEVGENGDTDYNETFTVGARDTFLTAGLSYSSGNVYGVQPRVNSKRVDAGYKVVSPIVKSSIDNGIYILGSGAVTTSYTWYQWLSEVDPGAGTRWTISGVNLGQFGYKLAV
jgi:hypothetical protein